MPTLRDEYARQALEARIDRLTPEVTPQWGTLTAHRMLCHLKDQMAVSLGDLETRDHSSLLTRTIVKWLILRVGLPRRNGKNQTLREMLSTEPGDWQADKDAVKQAMERLAAAETTARHPLFGALSADDSCVLAARHVDYHLQQFGV